MDRQVKASQAWLIPHLISQKVGGFSITKLQRLSRAEIKQLMTKPRPLHRFTAIMSENFHSAIQRIARQYNGDASRIWSRKPSSALVVYRFLEFDGIGPKIATMATNILAREFKIPLADHYSIDISADSHVRRVFGRLGLCNENPEVNQVIYKARALYPKFPGILVLPCWEIGQWCRPGRPDCSACYMSDLCPSYGR
jgi:endonuclease III